MSQIHSYASAKPNITQSEWEKLTKSNDFYYKNDIERRITPKQYQENIFIKAIRKFFEFLMSKEGNILIWILVILVVVFFFYKFFFTGESFLFGKSKKKLIESENSIDADEDLISTNWQKLLDDIINSNEQSSEKIRLAIRYNYKWSLQILQNKGMIQYRNDKTNYEYYQELKETDFKLPFKYLSRQYEYSWYGHYIIEPVAYNEYLAIFNDMRKQLGA